MVGAIFGVDMFGMMGANIFGALGKDMEELDVLADVPGGLCVMVPPE